MEDAEKLLNLQQELEQVREQLLLSRSKIPVWAAPGAEEQVRA